MRTAATFQIAVGQRLMDRDTGERTSAICDAAITVVPPTIDDVLQVGGPEFTSIVTAEVTPHAHPATTRSV